jgi:PAS domain
MTVSALSGSQQNFAISDPTLPDNPIVYVSQGFLTLTGYSLDQVLGRNCRFLQGPGTDQNAVEVIRRGISEGVDTSVCLLNYRADGTVSILIVYHSHDDEEIRIDCLSVFLCGSHFGTSFLWRRCVMLKTMWSTMWGSSVRYQRPSSRSTWASSIQNQKHCHSLGLPMDCP